MTHFKRALRAFLWSIPFLISGIAAPFIFTNIADRQIAGHYAGGLFLFSGVWLILLSIKHRYSPIIIGYVITFFGFSLFFWQWRFRTSGPLEATFLAGLRGDMWHHSLTGLYLVCLAILLRCEYKRA